MQSYLKTLSVAGGAGQIIKMSGRELCRALSEYIWQRQSSSHYADLVNKVIIRIRNTIRIIPSSQSVSMYSLCRANICRPQKLGLCQEAQTWSGNLLICSDLYDPGSWLGSGSLPKSHSNLLRPRNFVKVHPQVFWDIPPTIWSESHDRQIDVFGSFRLLLLLHAGCRPSCRLCCSRTVRSPSIPLLVQPFTRTDFSGRAFQFLAPSVWNSLPQTVLISDSPSIFKSRFKTYSFTQAFTDQPPAPLKFRPYGAIEIPLLLKNGVSLSLLLLPVLLFFHFFIPSVVKIPRVKSYKKIKNYSIGGQRSEPGGKLS